jgi:hypothetical protein
MVCIFKTAPVPLVLRPPSLAGESEHGAYTLVGEAYVHGIMNGEAFFMAAQENILEQCFTIAWELAIELMTSTKAFQKRATRNRFMDEKRRWEFDPFS